MKISYEVVKQSQVQKPVRAFLECQVYYNTENGIVPSNGGIYCDSLFADIVLKPIEEYCIKYDYSFAHIGCYNPRFARDKNGQPILDKNGQQRISNHAFGTAIDAKGLVTHGMIIGIPQELIDEIRAGIEKQGKKPEIVDEVRWWHIGFFQG